MFDFKFLLFLLILIPFSSGAVNILGGEIEVGDSSRIVQGVNIIQPSFNFSTLNVTAADFWITNLGDLDNANSTQFSDNSGTLNIKESWLTSFGNALWCALTGCTMSGDIDMGGNDVVNVSNITHDTASHFEIISTYEDGDIVFWVNASGTMRDILRLNASTAGNVKIKTASATNDGFPLDIVGGWQSPITLLQILLGNVETNATTKTFGIAGRHWYADEEPISLLVGQSSVMGTLLLWGGSAKQINAPTIQGWTIASDNTDKETATTPLDMRFLSSDAIVSIVETAGIFTKFALTDPALNPIITMYHNGSFVIWFDLDDFTTSTLRIGDGNGNGTGVDYVEIDNLGFMTLNSSGITIDNDDYGVKFGESQDVECKFDGTRFVCMALVGSPEFNLTGFSEYNLDNDTEIKGGLNQTEGNTTINNIYGEMWYHNHTGTVVNFAIASTWYPMFFTNATSLNGFGFVGGFLSSSNLTAQFKGKYKASYRLSGSGQNNHIYHSTILINTIEQENCADHKKMAAGGDVVPMGSSCFFDLSVGDNITVAVSDFGSTGTGEYHSGNLNLLRIGN